MAHHNLLSSSTLNQSNFSFSREYPRNYNNVLGTEKPKRGMRFWLCFSSLLLPTFLIALDTTAVSTPLPAIITDLRGQEFEWAGSAYALSATALQPFCGGLAQVFGRRVIMLMQIFLFALGSLLCGVSQNMTVLIVGRTVQGVGAGGIAALGQIILGDLVPLHERGVFTGMLAMAYGFGVAIGPLIGGALSGVPRWRWLFYMNLPICLISGIIVFLFVNLKTPSGSWREKINRLDWVGNLIIICSTTSCVLALTWGGIKYPWSSASIIVPLVLGVLGLAGFFIFEARVPSNPLVPLEVVRTRTAISGLIQTFLAMFTVITVVYYLPVYFLACRVVSPVKAGINVFGVSQTTMPFGLISGVTVARSGRYRPQLWFGWATCIVSMGLFSTLTEDSSKGVQVGYQILAGVGMGILLTTTVFPVLADVDVHLNANALAFYMFSRYMSQVWGVTAGGAILQNQLETNLPENLLSRMRIPTDTSVVYSIIPLIGTFPEPLRTEVRHAFASSLRLVWLMLVGVASVGLFVSLFMKGLPLHTSVDESWGLQERSNDQDREKAKLGNESARYQNVIYLNNY